MFTKLIQLILNTNHITEIIYSKKQPKAVEYKQLINTIQYHHLTMVAYLIIIHKYSNINKNTIRMQFMII